MYVEYWQISESAVNTLVTSFVNKHNPQNSNISSRKDLQKDKSVWTTFLLLQEETSNTTFCQETHVNV